MKLASKIGLGIAALGTAGILDAVEMAKGLFGERIIERI